MTLYRGQSKTLDFEPPPTWSSTDTEESLEISKEIINLQGEEVGCILRNVLTSEECQHFINLASDHAVEVSHATKYRNMYRIVTDSKVTSEVIYNRIRPHLKNVEVTEATKSIHQDFGGASHGTWEPQEINSRWRLCSYSPGGHFCPHYDGEYKIDSRTKSLQTCQLYLNGGFEGGGINFVNEVQPLQEDSEGRLCADTKNVLLSIQPEAGMAVIFNHRLMHEGEALKATASEAKKAAKKYFMRSEIMFQNVKPTGTPLSENDEEALRLVQEADRLEFNDEAIEAAKLWSRAFKLSPALEAHYNQCGIVE